MGTPHINAERGDFAKVVLMPGDPLRAKWICDTFLHDVKQVNSVRGMLGFTGKTKNGKTISVMASGMGLPSISVYAHELYSYFGVESIIRVGTAGSYQKFIHVGDIIIANGAHAESNWADQYNLGHGIFSAVPDFGLLENIVNASREKKMDVHIGTVLSADFFYNADSLRWKSWEKLGVLAVEMESYALFSNAAEAGRRGGAILTISDSFYDEPMLPPSDRQTKLVPMMELAIAAAEKELDALQR